MKPHPTFPRSRQPTSVRRHCPDSRRQRGFTLVEIAIALVLIGVLVAISLQSQGLVEQYRQSQFINQVRALDSNLQTYRNVNGRWPGDCNRDGLLDYPLVDSSLLLPELLDYAVPESFTAATDATTTYALGMVCPDNTLDPYAEANVVFNELKRGGLTPTGQPNRVAAAHSLGSQAYLGYFSTMPIDFALLEDRFNAIVLPRVTIAAARKLAVAIDGFDGSAANLHRVRRSSDMQNFDLLWTADGETEATRITVVVFFDRIPPHE